MAAACRWLLVVVFVAAAVAKRADHDRFLRSLVSLPWLGARQARVVARAVPALELLTAAALIAAPRAGAPLALGALVAFTAVIGVEVRSGRPFQCGCFGGTAARVAGRATLARNALLLVTAAGALGAGGGGLPAALTGAGTGLLLVLAESASENLPRGATS